MKSIFTKKISSFLLSFVILLFIFVPMFSSAQGIVFECKKGLPGECDFADLISAVKSVVNWGTIFALQFSVVVIAFAGFKYMQSGDNPSKRSAANEMLRKVVVGIFFILAAWVIVTLITNTLLNNSIDTFLK